MIQVATTTPTYNNSPDTNNSNPQLLQLSTTSLLSQSSIIRNSLQPFISNGDRHCMEQGTGVLSQLNMTGDLTGVVCWELVNKRNHVSGQGDQIAARKKQEREDLGKDNIDMIEKLTRGGKLTRGKFQNLGENLLSNI